MHRACSHTVPAIHSAYCHFSGGYCAYDCSVFFFCHRLISAESANPPARLIHKANSQERLLFTALALNSACYLQRLFVQWV